MKLIPVSDILESLIEECVGGAPEYVMTKDWCGISLRLFHRLEDHGLMITTFENAGRRPIKRGRR